MRYLFLAFALSLAFAPACLAQGQDYSSWEFYVGYAHERANNGADRLVGAQQDGPVAERVHRGHEAFRKQLESSVQSGAEQRLR